MKYGGCRLFWGEWLIGWAVWLLFWCVLFPLFWTGTARIRS